MESDEAGEPDSLCLSISETSLEKLARLGLRMDFTIGFVERREEDRFLGIWVPTEGDSTAEFTVTSTNGVLSVAGRDRYSGEAFIVSEIAWDARTLRFSTMMPSTGQRAQHVMRVLPDSDLIEHDVTLIGRWHRTQR